jgi:wobble nucleotide-excising tRNase
MIRKIDIKNFGLFSDFLWNPILSGDVEFKKVNVIYGRNYSGKTTLSRIFRCVENGQIHEKYADADFSISLGSENLTQDNLDTVPKDVKVRVYNTDFVKANLSWLHRDDGNIESFALLGNVELDSEIKEIEKKLVGDSGDDRNSLHFKLTEKHATHTQKQNVVTAKKEVLDELLRDKAREINKNHIKLSDNSSYNIESVRRDIPQATKSCILSDEKTSERKNLLKEEPKKDVSKISESKPKFSKFQDATNELLSREIKPDQPITDLINDNLLQNWVLAGIEIHKDKMNSCGFCGNPLPHDLWDKLDAHFSEESKKLRIDIENLIKELETAKQNIQGNAIKIPAKENLYSCFYSEYDRLLNLWLEMKVTYSENLDCLIKQLRRREKDIFKVQVAIEFKNLSDEMLALCIEFNQEVIEKHNNKTVTLTIDQKKARDELRLSEVAKFLKAIDYQNRNNEIEALKKEVAELESDKNQIKQTVNTLTEEKKTLKAKKHDERKGAELVNEYLTRFFSHDGLKLEAKGQAPTSEFKVMRNGFDATNLSEGECSLIAFCYFIAKINDELKDAQNDTKLIIYIDDPISSLDSNHVYFIFSLIDSVIAKPQKYAQLFISTHNLDFLKYLKRITLPSGGKNQIAHFLVECNRKQNSERSRLREMPEHIEKYATEFNYLFEQIYSVRKREMQEMRGKGDNRMMLNNDYTQFYNLPNNLRKFLECYLFFKYPNNDEPLKNLEKFFNQNENDASFINRVINEHSHLTHLDRGRIPMDIDEIEKCARLVLDTMQNKEPEQFNALVESVS